jgi:hypothetical protein
MRRRIHLVVLRHIFSHAEVRGVLRRAGYSEQQIEDVLRDLQDPIDTDRDGDALLKQGISVGTLMNRMSGSP